MCGIVGLFNKNDVPADPSVIRRMADRIAHRGPDGEGWLVEGPLGLYHKRLVVIDPATGQQPMSAEGVTIILNGEIYNYLELREELRGRGRSFTTASDTEVLLQAYLEYGPECVRRLNGMFAFVLYDRRRRWILAARDHFGIKPLYWWEGPGAWAFASEIKALLVHPAIPIEARYDAVREYSVFQHVLDCDTFFRGIRKIRPGHYLLVNVQTGTTESIRYWDLDFSVDTRPSEEDVVEKLRTLLEDAVRLQLRSDVPVGTALSGGIDSSLVALLASRTEAPPRKAYLGLFREGPEFDESPFAREVAREAGMELGEIIPTAADFIETLPTLVYHMDEPAAGPGLFPQYMVAKRASSEVKVLLGGLGADEIFGGYVRYIVAYLEQALKGAVFETADEGEHVVSLKSILPNLPALRRYAPMLQSFWSEGLFEPMDRRYFRLVDRGGGDRSLFSPDFRAGFDDAAIFERFARVFNHPRTLSYYNKMVHYDLTAGLPALLHVEDRVTMACGLESRVPLLDRRLAEFVATVPPRMKFHGAELKHLLKRAARGILPPAVLERKDKMGFPVPLHIWARNGLRPFARDVLLSKACRERGLFDPAAIERLVDNEGAYGRRLWGVLNIELWFRRFIDAADWKKCS